MAVELTGDAVSYADGDALIARRGAGTGTPVNVAPVGAAWGAAAREALKLLTGADRLPATAVRDLPVYREPIWGAGAPGPDDGKDGDTYIDGANNAIYGPKAAGVWPAPLSLSGDGGGIAEAPNDGGAYAREAGGWVEVGATLAALLTALDGKAAVVHGHALADITDFGATGLLVAAAETAGDMRAAAEIEDDIPAHWAADALLTLDGDRNTVTTTWAEAKARIAATPSIDGGAAGTDASGSVILPWSAGLGGWRRRAVGNITLDGVTGLPEGIGRQRFIFRQDGTGGRGLVIGAGLSLIGTADVSLDANLETAFDVFAVGSQVYLERSTPVVAPSWTHTLTIASPAAGQAGFGTGYGSISPNTIGVTSMLYFYASDTVPRVRMQFVGAAMPYTSMQVRFDDGSGLFRDFVVLPSDRYGMPGTDPAAATVSDWLLARVGQSVQMRIIPT